MPAASPSLHTPMQLKHGMGACLRPAPRTDNSVLVAKSLFLGVNAVRGGRAALHLFGLLPPPRVMAGGGTQLPPRAALGPGRSRDHRQSHGQRGKSESQCKDASAFGSKGRFQAGWEPGLCPILLPHTPKSPLLLHAGRGKV